MAQNWLDKAERKFGRYCIHGLMKYIVAIELVGAVIGVFNPALYIYWFSLDFSAIARGQVWRLITFIFFPEITSLDPVSILLFAIQVYLYYMIGNSLENMWGSFRFTLYYISGLVLSVLAGFILYIFAHVSLWPVGFEYVNQALFLAFATIFPDIEFLLFFILPVKAKWLGILYAVMMGFDVITYLRSGSAGLTFAVAIVISMLNFLIFFLSSRDYKKHSYREHKRKAEFRKNTSEKVVALYRHRCAICGRTDRDYPDLEFRYCSKCDGNYEYCADHIFTHEHVHR